LARGTGGLGGEPETVAVLQVLVRALGYRDPRAGDVLDQGDTVSDEGAGPPGPPYLFLRGVFR